jgi:cyclophilin family peptidyl-prolyl cis-trans isomerase
VTDQLQLDGEFMAFGRVVEGMEVVEKISLAETDETQRIKQRIEISHTFERDRPPPEEIPFGQTPVEELALYRAVIVTNLGEIEIAFYPQDAPEHVRRFLRFSELGLYTGTVFHRVVPGFVIQGGSMYERSEPVPEKYVKFFKPLKGEFNEHQHVRGTVSMARGDDPDSAIDSFFISLAPQPSLDGKYTVFGYVTKGIDTVDGISQVPVQGERPIMPVNVERMRVFKVE